MADFVQISELDENKVNNLIDRIKSKKVKLAVLFMSDCGLRLADVARLTPANLVFDKDGQLIAIQNLKRSLWKSHAGTRTISLSLLRAYGLISLEHEQEINSNIKNYKVSTRAVEISIKKISEFKAPDFRHYFIFKALRHKVPLAIIGQVFDASPLRYERILYTDELIKY